MDECAGLAATVKRTNGTQVEGRFPELVAIEQPVDRLSDFRSVTYDAGHDARVQIAFEGEIFENLRTSVTGSCELQDVWHAAVPASSGHDREGDARGTERHREIAGHR